MEELKNCPFCGKPFIFQEITEPGIEVIHENKECQLERFIGWFKSKEQAIKVLNARPIEDALQRRIDDLESKMKHWKDVLG
jgi:hypothetical protein